MDLDTEEEEKELSFLVKITRFPNNGNFFVVSATDSWKALEKVVNNFSKDNPISWSFRSISVSELVGDGDIKFQKTRFE